MLNCTPLRYPGGKSLMTSFFIDIFKVNEMRGVTYAEPYAGGAGTALNLLLLEEVDRIIINDANICVYSFWKYVISETQRFIDKIMTTPVDLETWSIMHNLIKGAVNPSFDLGFATFFLSRTNRSGILNAGPIGGNTPQKQELAMYKIDCRFNREDMAKRVLEIGKRGNQITVLHKDAIKFLKDLKGKDKFVYLDPPYYDKGKSLYLDYYQHSDHKELSDYLHKTRKFRWVLSYDNVFNIREMYKDFDLYKFFLSYTAQNVKQGSELLTHSRDLLLPEHMNIRRKGNDIPLIRIN